MFQVTRTIVQYPARASATWYIAVILVGSLALALPLSHAKRDQPISLLDAAFTATSAVCVTGLAVRSTEYDFSFVGQLLILLLIQLGGVGIMTVTTVVMFGLGGQQSLRTHAVIAGTLAGQGETDLRWILRHVLLTTFWCEAAGFFILWLRNLTEMPWGEAAWHAMFHAVSAFCNAGFSLNHTSLERYQGDWIVNLTIGGLVVVGGLGFPVLLDLIRNFRGNRPRYWEGLNLHSKSMLIGTAFLLLVGMLAFLTLEWDGVLAPMSLQRRPLVAFFHSLTCRTAGFNTVEIAELTNAMLFVSMLLMIVGAGPCSTAGGFKVTTLIVLLLQARAAFSGYSRINVFRRTIPLETVERAIATAAIFGLIAVGALTAVLVIEQSHVAYAQNEEQGIFLGAAFEVISALGTVGLSTGITDELRAPSRMVVIVLMLIGRLGPITVFLALARGRRRSLVEYPAESPLIG